MVYAGRVAYSYKGTFPDEGIVLKEGTKGIAGRAFEGCRSLSSLKIPSTVVYLSDESFAYKAGLTSITIPSSVTTIGNYAFTECTGLISVTMEEGVREIKEHAFDGCTNLASVTIPSSVTAIHPHAFYRSELDAIHISDLTKWCKIEFGNGWFPSFKDCHIYLNGKRMSDLVIPDGIATIKNYAFSPFSDITSLSLPSSVRTIGESAFQGCSKLTTLTLPDGITTIGCFAFSRCNSLNSVWIPSSVTIIGENAFSGTITSLTLSEGIQHIGSSSFNCSLSLRSLVLPSTIASIGYNTFRAIQGLNDVYCYAKEVPITDAATFENSKIENVTLHVPASAIESYRSTEPWKYFGKIVPISEEDGITETNAAQMVVMADNGQLTVTGLHEGTSIKIYDLSGRLIGQAVSRGRTTVITIPTAEKFVFVRMGEQYTKVVLR